MIHTIDNIIVIITVFVSIAYATQTHLNKTPWILAESMQPDGSPSFTEITNSGYPDSGGVCGTTQPDNAALHAIDGYDTHNSVLWTNLTASEEETQSVVVDDFYRMTQLSADYPGLNSTHLVNVSDVEFAFVLWTSQGPGVVEFTQMRWIKVPSVSQQFPKRVVRHARGLRCPYTICSRSRPDKWSADRGEIGGSRLSPKYSSGCAFWRHAVACAVCHQMCVYSRALLHHSECSNCYICWVIINDNDIVFLVIKWHIIFHREHIWNVGFWRE